MDGWMDGKVVLGEGERVCEKKKERNEKGREKKKSELTVSTHGCR